MAVDRFGGIPVETPDRFGGIPVEDNHTESPGFLKSVVGGLYDTKQTFEGAGALVGGAIEKYTPFEDLGRQTKDYWLNEYKATGAQAKPYEATMSFGEADSLKDYGTLLVEQGGRILPTIAAAALGAGVGAIGARGATELGGGSMIRALTEKAIEKNVQKVLATKVGQELGEKVVRDQATKATIRLIGAKAGMFGTVAGMESGGNYAEVAEQGINAPGSALLTGTVAASLELLGGNIKLIERFFGPAASKVIGKAFAKGDGVALKGASKALVDVAENMSAEALQEGGQELLSILNVVANTDHKLLTGENWDRIKESMAVGGMVGGMGGMVEVATKQKGEAAAPPAPVIDKETMLGKIQSAAPTLSDTEIEAVKERAMQHGITAEEVDSIVSAAREPGEVDRFAQKSSAYLKEKNAPKQPGRSYADDLFAYMANENTNFEMDRMVGEYQNQDENHANRLMGEWGNDAVDLANREPLRQGRKMLPEPVRDFSLVGEPYTPKEDQTPAELRPAIAKMEAELKGGTTGGVITNGRTGNEQEVTGRFIGTNPEWFQKKTVEAYDKANGTDYAKSVNKLSVLTAIGRMRKGEALNKTQAKAWEYLNIQARELQQKDPEIKLHQDASSMEQRGFDLVGQNMPAGKLRPGDKVISRGEEYHHSGFDRQGNAVLEGKETKRLDPFDQVAVDGIKRGNGVIQREDAKADPTHVALGMDNPDVALEHFERAIPAEDRATMADVFALVRKNGMHRTMSFPQQLFNFIGGFYFKRTGKQLAILGGNADNIKKEAPHELTTERRTSASGTGIDGNGSVGSAPGADQGVARPAEQAGAGPAGTERPAVITPDASDASAPSGEISTGQNQLQNGTADTAQPQPGQTIERDISGDIFSDKTPITMEPHGQGIIVKGDRAQVRAKLADAGVKPKGLPNAKKGGLFFAEKQAGSIRAALEVNETPVRETQADLSSAGETQVDIPGFKKVTAAFNPDGSISFNATSKINGQPYFSTFNVAYNEKEEPFLRGVRHETFTGKPVRGTANVQLENLMDTARETAIEYAKNNGPDGGAVSALTENTKETTNAQTDTADTVAAVAEVKPGDDADLTPQGAIKAQPFDSVAWNKERDDRIKESRAAGNTHLDQTPAYVETMRGKEIYNVHDQNERGIIRTVSNNGDVIIHWSDQYSADKNSANEKTEKRGRKTVSVWESWLMPSDLKDYVLARATVKQQSSKNTQAIQADTAEKAETSQEESNKPASEMTAAELLRAAADKMDAVENDGIAKAGKLEDFGEKIGGARKDLVEKGATRTSGGPKESGATWRNRFKVMENGINQGEWIIADTKSKSRWGNTTSQKFSSEEEAKKAVPLFAVADAFSPHQESEGKWEIYKKIGDRKRLKMTEKAFPSREEAMKHMALNAESLLDAKTSFGEEILPVPEIAIRKGVERRTKDATPEMFMETFAPRAIEFGNWNNQDERQLIMNHAFDGLLDLADVLGLPPKALMLDGDLAIAFGARGHGLSGAKAHYEPNYGVINLTKMKGAGSLAHEWMHALDHYLARLDTKAKSEKVANKRGDQVYPDQDNKFVMQSHGPSYKSAMQSHGPSYKSAMQSHGPSYKSAMRPELRDAYNDLIKGMLRKGEQYVEDSRDADEFLARSREHLREQLDSVRRNLADDLAARYTFRKVKKGLHPASAEQLAEFDRLADLLVEGGNLDTVIRHVEGKNTGRRFKSFGWSYMTNDTLDGISAILKDVRNTSGFAKDGGTLSSVSAAMRTYSARLKMLADAKDGTKKTKTVPTDYAIEARKMDQARVGDYWSHPHEMAARAFAAYVEDKIAENGGQSDFIVYRAHGGILLPMIDGFVARPYPEGKERSAINEALDKFVATIKTEETDKGVKLYSKATTKTGTTVAQVETELRTFLKRGYDKLTGSGKLRVVQSVEELPGGENRLNSVVGSNIPENIISELNAIHPGVEGFVSSHHGMITLHELRMPKELRGEGLGTKFMDILARYADESGMTISLTAAGDYGGSRSGQERFYARHGFVKNKGRNKDYRISENMIRRPQATQPLYSKDGSIAGTYDPRTGQITLVADNVKPGQAEYVLLHEGLHKLMREDVIFTKQYAAILGQFENLKATDKRVQDAFRRVPSDTASGLVREEALAYFIENKANHETSLFKKIMANIRMWLMRMGIPMKNLTTDDLVELVTQGMKSMANRATVKESLSVGDMGPTLYSKRSVVDDIFDTAPAKQGTTFTADLDIAEEGKATKLWDYLVFKAQDKFNSLKKVQEKAKKSRGLNELPESEDAYLAELRYHGQAGARIEDFHDEHVEPMIEAIHKAGLTLEDVGKYLWARHAPEANGQLEKINPDMENNTALSGMSNDEAQAVLDGFGSKREALEDIGKRVDAITKMRRDLLLESGLEKAETVAAWEKAYRHYVPLHREGKGGNLPSQGRGFDTRGKEKRRTGSEKDVVNILAHVVAQYEKTAIKAEKAKVGRALLEFVKNNPNPDMWEVDKVTFKPTFDKDGLVQYREDKGFILADNVLVVKVNGEDNRITFNQGNDHAKRIVSSMKNLGAEQSGVLVRSLATVNRVLAIVNTSANPEFVVSNLFRDLQTAGFNLNATEAKDLKAAIFKDVAKAWRGIRAAQKKDYRHPWARNYREFRQAGGKTGWMEFYKDIEHREAKLQKMLNEMGDGSMMKIKRGLNAIEQFVEHENTAVENAIRLSTFINARKAGISEARAAALAKELTVNFNRKGDAGQMLNALYLFYNASVQGTVRMFQAAKNPKVMAVMGGTVVAAAMLDMMNRAIGGDDDDGESFYDKLPGHITERNLIIMRPGGDYFKIPLPWGYNVLHVFGQEIGKGLDDSYRGYNAGKSAMRVLGAAASSFNPIGSEAGLLQMISPTITDPVVQWAENKDWSGRKLRPDSSFDRDKPESQKYWNSVREPSRWVAEKLNELTGGDQVRPGKIDISPELFDLWIDTFTGGAGRFMADMVATPMKALKGEKIEAHTIPLARKLYGSQSPTYARTAFYEHIDSIGTVKRQLEFYKDEPEKLAEIRAEHGDEIKMVGVAKLHEKAVARLRKERRAVEASKSLPDAEKKERLEKLDEKMLQMMQRFNRLYRERVLDRAA